MVEVLERIFEPFDLRQRDRHVDADFEKRVAEADRYAHVGRQPADAHDVGDLAVHVEDVGRLRFEQQALAVQVEIFAGVDLRPRRRPAQHAQPVEIVAQDRILDPQQIMTGAPDRLHLHERLLGRPRLVGIDHDRGALRHAAFQQIEPVQVAVEIVVADLDLEGAVAELGGVGEQALEFLVARDESRARWHRP